MQGHLSEEDLMKKQWMGVEEVPQHWQVDEAVLEKGQQLKERTEGERC